jgi:predicted ATP-grasp superfamily ATP-dependent carboligase
MNSELGNKQGKEEKLVIFGGSAASLFFMRRLVRKGWHVIMVTDRHEFASRSKYGEKYLLSQERPLAEVVEEILSKHGPGLKAMATDEYFLNQALRYMPRLGEQFDWLHPERETAISLLRKKTGYAVCRACNIPIPPIYELSELLASDRPEVYPLIGKRDAYLERTQKAGLPKCRVLRDQGELAAYAKEYAGAAEDILLQEKLNDSFRPVSVGGFYVDGKERCSIVVEQLRQNPKGVSCFVREAEECSWTDTVRGHIQRFVSETQYTGFLEMEFRTNNEVVWLLDINPRLWKWMKILAIKYPGFPHRMFADEPMRMLQKRAVWADPLKDLQAMLRGDSSPRGLVEYSPNMGLYIVDLWDWGPYSFMWHKDSEVR